MNETGPARARIVRRTIVVPDSDSGARGRRSRCICVASDLRRPVARIRTANRTLRTLHPALNTANGLGHLAHPIGIEAQLVAAVKRQEAILVGREISIRPSNAADSSCSPQRSINSWQSRPPNGGGIGSDSSRSL